MEESCQSSGMPQARICKPRVSEVEKNNGWSTPSFEENCKPTDSRGSMNPKQNTCKEEHTKAHHNQMLKTSDKEKSIKAVRDKR